MVLSFSWLFYTQSVRWKQLHFCLSPCLFAQSCRKSVTFPFTPLLLPPCCPGPVASLWAFPSSPYYPAASLTLIRLRAKAYSSWGMMWEEMEMGGFKRNRLQSILILLLPSGRGLGGAGAARAHQLQADNARLLRLPKQGLPASSTQVCSLSPQLPLACLFLPPTRL